MQRILLIAALVVCTARVALAQNVVGDWQAILKLGSVHLRLVLHIAQGNNGALKATLDSVDQGMNGTPVTPIVLSQSKLRFTVDSVNGSYEGTVNIETTTISGTWSQGQPLPLDSDVMFNLGVLYYKGQGVKQGTLARQWLEKAATAGDASAMFNLGSCTTTRRE